MVYTLPELRSRVKPIAERYELKAVFLFGSYARGDATETSDIDLLIDTSGTKIKTLLHLAEVLNAFEEALGKSVDLITVSSIEQKAMFPGDERFRTSVINERVSLYAAA